MLYRIDGAGRRLGPEGTLLIHPDGSIIVDGVPQGAVVCGPAHAGRAFGPSGTVLDMGMVREAGFGPEGTVILRERMGEVDDNGGRGRRLGRERTILFESREGGLEEGPIGRWVNESDIRAREEVHGECMDCT